MINCDLNLITTMISALAAAATIYLFLKSGIEKIIQRQTETLHKDMMGIKDDLRQSNDKIEQTNKRIEKTNERIEKTNERIEKTNERIDIAIKEMRQESRQSNARIDRSYQMFVELLTRKTLDNPQTDP